MMRKRTQRRKCDDFFSSENWTTTENWRTDEKCTDFLKREPNHIQYKSVSHAQLLIPGNSIWTSLAVAFVLSGSHTETHAERFVIATVHHVSRHVELVTTEAQSQSLYHTWVQRSTQRGYFSLILSHLFWNFEDSYFPVWTDRRQGV